MNRSMIAALAPLALLSACAHDRADYSHFSESQPQVQTGITHYADANRDGEVTKKEAQPYPALTRNFDKYDSNKDGVLDAGEFARLEADSASHRSSPDEAAPEPHRFRGHPHDPSLRGEQPGDSGERGP